MTFHGNGDGHPEQLQEQILRVVQSFARFGVSAASPDYISVSDGPADAIARSRAKLVDVLQGERLKQLDTLGQSELQALLLELVRLCVEGRLQKHLADANVHYPIYNFFAGFDDNVEGPWASLPETSVRGPIDWELMGLPIQFPIGVPASGLTSNSQWIRYFACRGFNILTYKTVRSLARSPHRWPHWVFIEEHEAWEPGTVPERVRGDLETWPKDLSRFATANSFGVPSPPPEVWQQDVSESLALLEDGQLLIVSVMGTSDAYRGTDLIEDFVRVAQLAEETGAPAIELNLSCPNTVRHDGERGMEPLICTDPEASGDIVSAVRAGLQDSTKLIAKLAYLESPLLDEVVSAIGDEVDAVSGINTLQLPVESPTTQETPFIGTNEDAEYPRTGAGVSGSVIRELGLDFVRRVADLGRVHDFDVIGMGGVMNAADVDDYLRSGAGGVQSATGACLRPDLPREVVATLESRQVGPAVEASRLEKIATAFATGGYSLLTGRAGGRR